MSTDRSTVFSSLGEPVALSFDVVVVFVLTVASAAIVSVFDTGIAVLEVVSGLALFGFFPGYLVVSALFPTESVRSGDGSERSQSNRELVSVVERLTLSIAGSLSGLLLVGFVLNFTPLGITLDPIVLSLCVVSLLAALVAIYRRWHVPEPSRFSVATLTPVRTDGGSPSSRRDIVVNGFGAFTLLFATGTIVHTIASPPRGETYTEFHLLTRNDDDELVADDYPREFEAGDSRPVTIGIDNNEQQSMEYSVVVAEQRVDDEGDTLEVTEQNVLDEIGMQLAAGDSVREELELAPTLTGDQIRLVFLLYRDDVPDDPSMETAYRDLHVWVSVEE